MPTPHPHTPKEVPGYGGGGGVQIGNSVGEYFLSQNHDLTRGWTSDTTTWGMLRERPQEGGGGRHRLPLGLRRANLSVI